MVCGVGHIDICIVGNRRCNDFVLLGNQCVELCWCIGFTERVKSDCLTIEIWATNFFGNVGISIQCFGCWLVSSSRVLDGYIFLTVYNIVGIGIILRNILKIPSCCWFIRPIADTATHVNCSIRGGCCSFISNVCTVYVASCRVEKNIISDVLVFDIISTLCIKCDDKQRVIIWRSHLFKVNA